MRSRFAIVIAAAALALEPAAIAAESPDAGEVPEAAAPSREQRLDNLFDKLKSAKNPGEAKAAESGILQLWLQSGSDTVDLLMSWAMKAMDAKEYPLALDYLDRIVTMKPDYAEGWNKRATVYFLIDDYEQSIADIRRALALEPRHFGALSGLGMIMREIGDDKRAIDAYKRALAVDPHLDSVRKALEEVEKANAGRDI